MADKRHWYEKCIGYEKDEFENHGYNDRGTRYLSQWKNTKNKMN
jgi:hypothetical protein